MSEKQDIFGLAFRDYLDGKTSGQIAVGLDVAETEMLPVSYFFRSYDAMPLWEQKVLDACRGRVLDVGAGAGSHALELQRRGLDVTALDLSLGAVEAMKERGIDHAFCMDFFQWKADKPYDALLFLMNGAGIAGTLKRLPVFLNKAKSLLAPGGTIYLESSDLIYLYEEEDGSFCVPMGDRYYGEVVYGLSYGNTEGEAFPWLFVDLDNLSDATTRCGLHVEVIYPGEAGNYVVALTAE